MSHDTFDENDWKRFLKHIGEDPNRPGLHETPARGKKRGVNGRRATSRIRPKCSRSSRMVPNSTTS